MPNDDYLIDIGANLTHESFDKDRDEVIRNAWHHNVKQMIITGADQQSSIQALELSKQYPQQLFSTAGVHPHCASECNQDTLSVLSDLALQESNVAIGECGLDYNRDFSPRATQRKWFEKQLELACELNKPVFLHERDASSDFLAILKDFHKDLPAYVVHCFTGSQDELEHYLDIDSHIGITGWICDERRGHHLHEFVKIIPDSRLMIETDAPYLLPRDLKPKPKSRRNLPEYLPHIAATIAKHRQQNINELVQKTTQTTLKFFRIKRLS